MKNDSVMPKKTRDYITGYQDYKALKEGGVKIKEKALLKNKSEAYCSGWEKAKND